MIRTRLQSKWTLIALVASPWAAFAIAAWIQHDWDDAFGASLSYFGLPFLGFFLVFRAIVRPTLRGFILAIPIALAAGFPGFWFGGLGVCAALLLTLALPPYEADCDASRSPGDPRTTLSPDLEDRTD
jgi:hypothetical protein